MGIIKRQSIKHSIVGYTGVLIGAISFLFVYPHALDIYGMYQMIFSSVQLLLPFVSLGMIPLLVKFFPKFKEDEGQKGILPFVILVLLFGFFLFYLGFPWLEKPILEIINKDNKLFIDNMSFIPPILFLVMFSMVFFTYMSNYKRIVVPSIFIDLTPKLALPLLVLLFYYNFVSVDGFLWGAIITYSLILTGLIIYTYFQKRLFLSPNFKFLNKNTIKEMGTYASFNIFTLIGGRLAQQIDILMVGALTSVTLAGVYALGSFIAQIFSKPIVSIGSIASPIISESWESGNLEEIRMIYRKSSINLFALGLVIFLLIWTSIDDLFFLMPETDMVSKGKYVILFLMIGKLFDMLTSVNSHIIMYSKMYKFNFYALGFLAIFNVVFNYIFINRYGITGAAIATMTSLALFNFVKVVFLYAKYKIHPFAFGELKAFIIASIIFMVVITLPSTSSHFLNIMMRGSLILALYIPLIYSFKVSTDINNIITELFKKIGIKI